MLLVVGIFNVIDGIAAIANSHLFVANAHYVIGARYTGSASTAAGLT